MPQHGRETGHGTLEMSQDTLPNCFLRRDYPDAPMRGIPCSHQEISSPGREGVRHCSWAVAPRELDCMGLGRVHDTSL